MSPLSWNVYLVGGFNLPLWKMMEWVTVGMIFHSQYEWKVIIHAWFQSPPIRYPLPLCLALRRSKQLHRSPRYAANMEFLLEPHRFHGAMGFHGEFTGFMVNNNVVLTGKFSILIYIIYIYLVGGWPTPLKKMKVSWDDYPIYYGKKHVF